MKLYTDGGARGNPGPAGIGGILLNEDNVVVEFSHYIGRTTNNVAEYKALIKGLQLAEGKTNKLECYLDSQLVVRQLKGEYKVKQPHLRQLVAQVHQLGAKFSSIKYQHIAREKNKRADGLVNQALDSL